MGRAKVDEGGADGNASLGGLVEEFGPSETVRTQYIIIAFVGIAVGAIVTCVAFLSPEGSSFGNKLAGLIFLTLGAVFVWGLRRQEGVGVRVYERGLVYRRRGREQVFRWDEVEAFGESQTVHEDALTGMKSGVAHVYSLRRRDGASLTLDNEVAGVARLGALMREATGRRLVTRATEAVNGGGLAQFGEFVVTRAGLAHKSKTLAWEEVGRAAVEDGRVVVKDRAGGEWAGELYGFVPNAHVFLALVNGRNDFGF
jgi:hypothetical protein